jgi:hypothetical protein
VNALSLALHHKLTLHPINEARAKEGKDLANVILLRGCGGLYDVPLSLFHPQPQPPSGLVVWLVAYIMSTRWRRSSRGMG